MHFFLKDHSEGVVTCKQMQSWLKLPPSHTFTEENVGIFERTAPTVFPSSCEMKVCAINRVRS